MKKITKIFTILLIIVTLSFSVYSSSEARVTYKEIGTCNYSPQRRANTTIDVGVGRRVYLARTNAHKQLIRVSAQRLVLQNKNEHLVHGRYCMRQASVAGTASPRYDRGHAIADSLGGTSNAYNITAQDAYTNRRGNQAKLEQKLRDALHAHKAVTNFVYNITYSNTHTQIPAKYYGSYKINGHLQRFSFVNASHATNLAAHHKAPAHHTTAVHYTNIHWNHAHTHCYATGHRGSINNSYCAHL